ncbi:hypothetical protein NHQ30_001931 [Ciborinia camelliae]|nr:hypothetical protein NHQ30_001931 [Ciborinia camelliae]
MAPFVPKPRSLSNNPEPPNGPGAYNLDGPADRNQALSSLSPSLDRDMSRVYLEDNPASLQNNHSALSIKIRAPVITQGSDRSIEEPNPAGSRDDEWGTRDTMRGEDPVQSMEDEMEDETENEMEDDMDDQMVLPLFTWNTSQCSEWIHQFLFSHCVWESEEALSVCLQWRGTGQDLYRTTQAQWESLMGRFFAMLIYELLQSMLKKDGNEIMGGAPADVFMT